MGDDTSRKFELDVERHLLGTTVRLSDGSEGLVFSRAAKNESQAYLYNCHLCGVANLPGERCLQTHIAGRKHQIRLTQPVIDAAVFRQPLVQKSKIQMDIAPGEPVPPGFENEVKAMAEIQPSLNKIKDTPLVGLEYIIELTRSDSAEPNYICLLCDKRGDPRTIISHITSYNHRYSFLEKHYTAIIKELAPYRFKPNARLAMPLAVQRVCEAVEEHHGRLTPTVYESNEFTKNRGKVMQEIAADKHFDEKHGPSFINTVDKKLLQDPVEKTSKSSIPIAADNSHNRQSNAQIGNKRNKNDSSAARKGRESLDSISSISSSSLGHRTPIRGRGRNRNRSRSDSKSPISIEHVDQRATKKKRKSQSPAYRIVKPRMSRSPPFGQRRSSPKLEKIVQQLPTPRELSLQASEIAHERYKWEKYRCMLEIAVKELEKILKEFEKNPEKHPQYPEEWKKFWNRRYKELQTEKKDPNKHDFKPEWIVFWTGRMKEIHNENIEKKKLEIRKKLGLPEIGEEKTDMLREQYALKPAKKVEKIDKLPVIDISDDSDNSLSSNSNSRSKRKKYSVSPKREYRRREERAGSKLSRDYEDRYPHERYPSDYYRSGGPEHWSSRSGYYPPPPPPGRFGYRTLDAHSYPKYEPIPSEKPEEKEIDEGPLTVIGVLRLLAALEDHLGSLGPKINDLLAKALALEKVKAYSSDEMLLHEDYCVFFETVKEKLKGLIIANVLDSNKIKAVKKAVKNIASIIHQVTEKAEKSEENGEKSLLSSAEKSDLFSQKTISSRLAAALAMNNKTDVSTDDMNKLTNIFVLMVKLSKSQSAVIKVGDILSEILPKPEEVEVEEIISKVESPPIMDMFEELKNNDEEPIAEEEEEEAPQNAASSLEGLTDSDLQTLLQNFKHLSSEEQHHLIAHLKKLESTDPLRVEKLRKFVDISTLKGDSSPSPKRKSKDVKEPSPSKDPKIMYSDDEERKIQQMIDSDDDDDYNFDDVVKAASNNLKEPKSDEHRFRSDSVSRDHEGELSNMSKASSTSTTNINLSLADTKNLIANLMGSLQKNNISFNQSPQGIEQLKNFNNIPTIVGRNQNIPQQNSMLPFFQPQQQQQQQQPQSTQIPNMSSMNAMQNQMQNSQYPNDLYNNQTAFFQNQFNQQTPGNYPFNQFAAQNPSMQQMGNQYFNQNQLQQQQQMLNPRLPKSTGNQQFY